MYAYIKGTVEEIYTDKCVIGTGAVGYNLMISAATARALPPIGTEAKLYTYTSVREDAFELIGFLTNDDLNMFKQLITVSGIGSKVALSLMSVMSSDQIRIAIVTGDAKSLSSAPGLGKKGAERIIVDLKGKYSADELLSRQALSGSDGTNSRDGSELQLPDNVREAAEALAALGFSRTEALSAIRKLDTDSETDVDYIITETLKIIR